MIIGIGVDLVQIDRFQRLFSQNEQLRYRLYGPSEQNMTLTSLAGRFAAKEALYKAFNQTRNLSMSEIEIANDSVGRPYFIMNQSLEKVLNGYIVHLSITHDLGVAMAFVVIEKH